MKSIDLYIFEKLKLNKDSDIEQFDDKNSVEYIEYLCDPCSEYFYIENVFGKPAVDEEYVRLRPSCNDTYKMIEKSFGIKMEKHSSENYIAICKTNKGEWFTCFKYKTPGGSVITDYQFTDVYNNPDALIKELLDKFKIKH